MADLWLSAESYADAISKIGEHFPAQAAGMRSDHPDDWTTDASLMAPQFEPGSSVYATPAD